MTTHAPFQLHQHLVKVTNKVQQNKCGMRFPQSAGPV